MYIVPSLKLNKFREVNIPSNRDFFIRFGFKPSTGYTGEYAAPLEQRKVDGIAQADFEEVQRAFEESQSQTESE